MKRFLLALVLAGALGARANAGATPDVIPAQGGPIRITPIFHGSLQIEYGGKVIHVDPFSAGDYKGAKKADVVLITHSHGDHLDKVALARVIKRQTIVFAPESVVGILKPKKRRSNEIAIYSSPEASAYVIPRTNTSIPFGLTLPIGSRNPTVTGDLRTVPMYNLVRGPKPGQKFHPKGESNGYILTLGGKRIYIAGDTEATPEMKALKNIDIAFLPMNLPYTMTPQEAAAGARAFKPKIVYPYHYRYPFTKANDNPQQFAKALAGSGIQVRMRDWYGNAAKK